MAIFKKDPLREPQAVPVAASISKDLARALACPECSQRENVIANLKGGAYSRPEDLAADLLVLEAMPKN